MTANYQSQDLWSRALSRNGYRIDELRSVLQKSIRRGLLEEAMLAGYELFASGAETAEMLWRRLEIIAVEDVGTGLVEAPAIIEALYRQQRRMADPGDDWMYPAHAIRLLATARKDRTTMELAGWAREVLSRGERRIVIEDYHIDQHTARGVELGRGPAHWWQEGARLENEVEGLPGKYGDYLRALEGGRSDDKAE